MDAKLVRKLRPYAFVLLLQMGFSGLGIIGKAAMNEGANHYSFSVYRNAIAALFFAPFAFFLERKERPRMTISVFLKILLLAFLDPVIGQNMYYGGLGLTTATVASALCNLLPALTFVIAWLFRVERVNARSIRSHAKIWGTVVTVSGAMIMTLYRGSIIGLPWAHQNSGQPGSPSASAATHSEAVKGALMISAGCLSYSTFFVLQSITLESYPAGMSLAALICFVGSLEAGVVALIAERNNTSIWALGWNMKLLGYAYGSTSLSAMV
ncbi:hypothetical protein M569_13004 [Genlisea aurea]|uniref:WAT1-related protein n=1 Tax=Genlisea aurea TaxID=192259 RepID=S8C4H8_9LAMI|nr:hypothetical protein M569_13004 [Genlisea aurea]